VRLSGRTKKLAGESIELRRHVRENYSLYADWYADPEVWHLTSWTAAPLGRSAVERLFEDREKSITDDSFAIHVRGEREPIGVISLMNISEANTSADLSVILGHPGDRDRGHGADAIATILDYAFGELGLHRVGLSVFEFNQPAIAAYDKLGFQAEGRLRQAIKRDGTFHDAILMSILEPEWRAPSA
jgi:RimJ/RimL family protein N-acetyltransferase